MKNRVVIFITLLLVASFFAEGQNISFQRITYPVVVNGAPLSFPFAGGLNAPQFYTPDLNNDGVADLVVFDRLGDVVLTFLHTGTNGADGYVAAPEYADYFPFLQHYIVMRDFNDDGAMDIFAASTEIATAEIQVFRGFYENNILKFQQMYFSYPSCSSCNAKLIYYPDEIPGVWNNLAVQRIDIPDVNDTDGDGDLDILTFEATAGGHVYWFRNMSVEKGFGKDSLKFELADRCWGDFYEGGIIRCKNSLSPENDVCAQPLVSNTVDDRDGQRHPGSTLLSYDHDGDGDKELILGEVSFTCLNWQLNNGTPQDAWMTAQDTAFPIYDVPVDIQIFPAAFYLDVDHDGHNDLVAAPNNKTVSEDIQSAWYYRNIATQGHNFRLITRSFLVEDMIDVGTVAHPAVADVNGDGLPDLVVGNYGFYTTASSTNSRLVLYLNTGTLQQPVFERADNDWLGMAQFAAFDFDFSPAFGDLDGDGDQDLVVGSNAGTFFYYKNNAGPGQPMNLVLQAIPGLSTLDIGVAATPFVFDLDGDGLQDLLVGERQGNINYLKNTGSAGNPQFGSSPTIVSLGGINTTAVNDFVGFSAPTVVIPPGATAPLLVAGSQSGALKAYSNIGPVADPFVNFADNLGNQTVGNRSHPVFADLDHDGLLEVIIGNSRGGLEVFKVMFTSSTGGVGEAMGTLRIFPNPASTQVQISTTPAAGFVYRIYDVSGRLVASGDSPSGNATALTAGWAPGLYVLQVQQGNQLITSRFIIQ